jgi:hypothetical protein
MTKKLFIPKKTREIVVSYCNNFIVPDNNYIDNPTKTHTHPIDWFKDYFDFIGDTALKTHLAEAYYQARFIYKIMQGLQLTSFKRNAFVKFQIQQYASIYEALLDFILEKYNKEDIKEKLKEVEYKPISVFASNVECNVDENGQKEKVFTCRKSAKKINLKNTRIDKRTEIAASLGIISQTTKQSFDNLYDLRNNIHLLKASIANYRPKVEESFEAFKLMSSFVLEVKTYVLKFENQGV